ncbi:response regulator transcription factor [Pseudomonas sp. dw_612]|uniref:response regulator transcription factor n=1 Tax=Pseudomonas sp. dw_612 TaxID=2720080 RepID=UPI003209D838
MIVDDHPIMREGLKQLFALTSDLKVVAEAENGELALQRLKQGDIDLLLLDMNMPGLCGEPLLTLIHTKHPRQKTLVLSMHNDPQVAIRALKAGATGYLCKVCSLETLLGAVRRVACGERIIDPHIAECIAFEANELKQQFHHDPLTARESQILHLFALGASVTQIARKLTISSKTVSTHKTRLMEKLGFSSNAEIVRYAVSQRIIK